MLFEEKSLLDLQTEDYLWPIGKVFRTVILNRIFVHIQRKILVALSTVVIIQTGLFLRQGSAEYFIKYMVVYLSSFFFLVSLYSTPTMGKSVFDSLHSAKLWQLKCKSIQQQIENEAFYTNICFVLCLMFSQISGILFITPLENDEEFFYFLGLYEHLSPKWKSFCHWNFRIDTLFIGIISLAPCYALIYLMTQSRFQYLLLLHDLKNLNWGYEHSSAYQLIRDLEYQEEIKRRLKFCIKRHAYVNKISSSARRQMQGFARVFTISGVILFISIIMFFYSYEGAHKNQYLRIISLGIPGGLTWFHILTAGQMHEDVTCDILKVLKTINWESWNKENRKTFIIMLQNSQKGLKIKLSENISVNFALGVSMSRALFSVISVMKQLKMLD
ncbi:hypothetical protein TcasGA2_TC031336 [Tribolium castaneum]|uniref:Odorant receptor n=1 Tax=Tribolium castaneum TaxID=7070 RepID=A0A139WB58_TRICA|nr:PREDICTED: uncharacterized protein LOC107398727 [Tribolium castaneum]KYB25157.1 hypothetical protein TcasGA2_TC031336 [Tribolium castaneum]|eukprot:XP_015839384.1 PREDICTED: uncharacterized protein LOC107398727 [Tribolium castaneum]